jgi:lysozyme family protein
MAEFELAITATLKNEGGYVDNPSDPGGETNFGISKRSYPDVDIKNLTEEEASAIYLRDFWKFDGIDNQMLANKVFDMSVNMGHYAIRILQRLLSGLAVDGEYGADTEKEINAANGFLLLIRYQKALEQHYRDIATKDPAEEKFLADWLRRAAQ